MYFFPQISYELSLQYTQYSQLYVLYTLSPHDDGTENKPPTKLMQLFGQRSGCEILVWHHPDLHLPGALCANHSSSEHFQHQLILKVTLANCPPLETHSGTAPNGTKVSKWSQKVSIFKQGPKMVLSHYGTPILL